MFNILLFTILLEFLPFISKQETLPNVQVRDKDIVDVVNSFYELDYNAVLGSDLSLDYQGYTNLKSTDDKAPLPLFKYVNPRVTMRPTFRALYALMNNYIPEVGMNEKYTTKERQEIDEFLKAIMNTTIAKQFCKFLTKIGHPFAKDKNILTVKLKQYWFDLYSRSNGPLDSSGFEHIFMGEIKRGEVSGLHSWFRFFVLEANAKNSNFDYKGVIVKRFETMASVKFSWKGNYKKGGSFFIRTSPEFDFFVYSLCFFLRRGNNGCNIEVNGCPASITVHELHQNNKLFIGSLFPNIGGMTEECKIYNTGNRR